VVSSRNEDIDFFSIYLILSAEKMLMGSTARPARKADDLTAMVWNYGAVPVNLTYQ
jgi:hypothetical protein